MKLFPKIKNESMCQSLWERSVMYRIESRSKHLGYAWGIALVWTAIWVFAGSEGADRPMIFSFFFIITWFLVIESYTAKAILRIIERNHSGEIPTKQTKV